MKKYRNEGESDESLDEIYCNLLFKQANFQKMFIAFEPKNKSREKLFLYWFFISFLYQGQYLILSYQNFTNSKRYFAHKYFKIIDLIFEIILKNKEEKKIGLNYGKNA